MNPYKVVPGPEQNADIIDRATGHQIGYVLQWAHGWSAYMADNPGVEIVFAVVANYESLRPIFGDTRQVTRTRYRVDAAQKVWDTQPPGSPNRDLPVRPDC